MAIDDQRPCRSKTVHVEVPLDFQALLNDVEVVGIRGQGVEQHSFLDRRQRIQILDAASFADMFDDVRAERVEFGRTHPLLLSTLGGHPSSSRCLFGSPRRSGSSWYTATLSSGREPGEGIEASELAGTSAKGIELRDDDFELTLPAFVSVVRMTKADGLPGALLPEEEALLHPRVAESRRLHFRLGRTAAHRALDRLAKDSGPLLRGDHRQPLWPAGVVGSITHTAGQAWAAVAPREFCGGIGIDLESQERSFDELAEYVAFDQELDWLEAVPAAGRVAAVTALFSAKESIYKAFFPRVGEFFGFSAARVTPANSGGFEGRLVSGIDPEYPVDRSFPITVVHQRDLVLTSVVLEP